MMPMFSVLRYVQLGHRQYQAGDKITDLDIEGWETAAADVEKAVSVAIGKGQIEPISLPVQPAAAAVSERASAKALEPDAAAGHPVEEPSPAAAG